MAYYVFDDAKNLFEGMTKEQIVNAIAAATGLTPEQIDADVITSAIKEQNAQKSVNLWIGTQNEYNAIQQPDENTLYCVTDPHETNELQAQVNQLQAEINELVVQNTENATGFKIETQTQNVNRATNPHQLLRYVFTVPEGSEVIETAYREVAIVPWNNDNINVLIDGTSVAVTLMKDEINSCTLKIVYAYPEAVDLSELTDIRVGADGTVYRTAGEAVRRQIYSNRFHDYIKQALLNLLAHVAYIDGNGQQYYNALERAMYMTAGVVSITAVFNQGENVVYDTDDLDTLRQYLTVTARYEDNTSEVITEYTLSGTLTVGTSTITVSYGGKTATFDVTVSTLMLNDILTLDGIQNTRSGHNASATAWEDLSGNQHDFVAQSGATLAWGTDHAAFDATNRVMKCVADLQGSGNKLTVEIIIVNDGDGTTGSTSTTKQGYVLVNTPGLSDVNGQFKFYSYIVHSDDETVARDGLSTRYGSTSLTYSELKTAKYIAYVFDGTNMTKYVNGVSSNTVSVAYQSGTKSQNWAIGGTNDGDGNGGYFNGKIFRIGISAKAMTAEEIANRYAFFAERFEIV